MQQKRNSTVFSVSLALFVLVGTAAAKQLSMDYSFDRPEVSKIAIEDKLYDRVTMPEVPNCGNAGEPALPAKGARILQPFGSENISHPVQIPTPVKQHIGGLEHKVQIFRKPLQTVHDAQEGSTMKLCDREEALSRQGCEHIVLQDLRERVLLIDRVRRRISLYPAQ